MHKAQPSKDSHLARQHGLDELAHQQRRPHARHDLLAQCQQRCLAPRLRVVVERPDAGGEARNLLHRVVVAVAVVVGVAASASAAAGVLRLWAAAAAVRLDAPVAVKGGEEAARLLVGEADGAKCVILRAKRRRWQPTSASSTTRRARASGGGQMKVRLRPACRGLPLPLSTDYSAHARPALRCVLQEGSGTGASAGALRYPAAAG